MLAYTFWHWRRADVTATDYEARQRAFHHALAAAPPEGFQRSWCHAIAGAPWAADGANAYEDRYVVNGSADLDRLNAAAITASRAAPHDMAAAAAAGGIAGLYTLRVGPLLDRPRIAYWFSKPDGMPYDALFAVLEPTMRSGLTALWMRYMTLGPTPEFCLQATTEILLSSRISGRTIQMRDALEGTDIHR